MHPLRSKTILMPQDWLLLRRIASRDAQALADLYDVHSGAIYSLALRILRNQKSAEVVVQHTFVSVWEKAERYGPKLASVSTWLFAIARNLAIDEWRKESRSREVALGEEIPDAADRSEQKNPLSKAIQGQRREIILRALSEIPEEQKQAIYLAYYDGLSHRQIAETLEQPLGTVKTRIQLGLEKLRRRLAPVFRND